MLLANVNYREGGGDVGGPAFAMGQSSSGKLVILSVLHDASGFVDRDINFAIYRF